MSYMKQYAEDTEAFKLRAIETAWLSDSAEREVAFSELVRDCRTAAAVYHWPAGVTAMFVHTVSETYAAERLAQKETVA